MQVVGEGGELAGFACGLEAVLEEGGLVEAGDGEAAELVEDDGEEGADVADAVDGALVGARLHELLPTRSVT